MLKASQYHTQLRELVNGVNILISVHYLNNLNWHVCAIIWKTNFSVIHSLFPRQDCVTEENQ